MDDRPPEIVTLKADWGKRDFAPVTVLRGFHSVGPIAAIAREVESPAKIAATLFEGLLA